MTRRDILNCAHEPFGDAFYYGPERLSDRFENDEDARIQSGFAKSTYKTVTDRLEHDAIEVRSSSSHFFHRNCNSSPPKTTVDPFFVFFHLALPPPPIVADPSSTSDRASALFLLLLGAKLREKKSDSVTCLSAHLTRDDWVTLLKTRRVSLSIERCFPLHESAAPWPNLEMRKQQHYLIYCLKTFVSESGKPPPQLPSSMTPQDVAEHANPHLIYCLMTFV